MDIDDKGGGIDCRVKVTGLRGAAMLVYRIKGFSDPCTAHQSPRVEPVDRWDACCCKGYLGPTAYRDCPIWPRHLQRTSDAAVERRCIEFNGAIGGVSLLKVGGCKISAALEVR